MTQQVGGKRGERRDVQRSWGGVVVVREGEGRVSRGGRQKVTVFKGGGALTQLEEPALAVGVKESVCQVIPIILGDLEGLVTDAVIQVLGEGEEGEELWAGHAYSRPRARRTSAHALR